MTNTSLNMEINSMPKAMREEVANFVAFLKSKIKDESTIKKRQFGFASGKIILSSDFDTPMEDFRDYI